MDDKVILRGKLIVFEGIDRSGKSSQIELLTNKLSDENIKYQVITFPNQHTPTGMLLRDYLRNRDQSIPHQALHLLFSANRWEEMNRIIKLLESGIHVITDRYAYSGISYSVGAEGLNFEWCLVPDSGILQPDVVFYMDLPPEASSVRGDFGIEIYENLDVMLNVYEVFKKFSHLSYWKTINATEDKNTIHEKIYSVAKQVIETEDNHLTKLRF